MWCWDLPCTRDTGCSHHYSLSTPICQPWRGASRSCYFQLPGTSHLTSQRPSWHQNPTRPHKALSLKAQTCPVSLLRETQSLKSCHDSQVCHTSLTRRFYQQLEKICLLKYEGSFSQQSSSPPLFHTGLVSFCEGKKVMPPFQSSGVRPGQILCLAGSERSFACQTRKSARCKMRGKSRGH